MSPLYDLILQRKGELQTETVQVADVAQAWRLGRERYPHCIRGVVRRDAGRDGSAAEPSKPRQKKGIRTSWDGAAARVARVKRSHRSDGAVFQDPAGGGLLR